MTILRNSRHEKFAFAVFQGKTQQDAAIEAGYLPKWARCFASHLATNSNIIIRIAELHKEAETPGIMDVTERKERLSEISRARITDFVKADSKGAHIEIGLDSAHSAALQEVTTRTERDMDGSNQTDITKLKLHDPVRSIAELNRMGGDYAPEKHAIIGDIIVEVVYVNRSKNKGTSRAADRSLPPG